MSNHSAEDWNNYNGASRPQGGVTHVAEVRRHGDKLVIPKDMTYAEAADFLGEYAEAMESEMCIQEEIPCLVFDGAIALKRAIEEIFGMAHQKSGMFSMARAIGVQVSRTESVQVPWSEIKLPGLEDGWITPSVNENAEGRIVFHVHAHVKGKFEEQVRKLISRVREIVAKESIYRGQAIQVQFRGANGRPLPMPEVSFLNLEGAITPIYQQGIESIITANVLTPIRNAASVKAAGIPLKRGVLLPGEYGTGKTLLAAHVARIAVENGWTFVYGSDVSEFADLLRFAGQYGPCVLFAEDIERIAGAERTDAVNKVLNLMDGVDTKNADLMVLLTTNHPEQVNRAMMRPGRIDVTIPILPPDAEAALRLVSHYANGQLDPDSDLTEVGERLSGLIPAVIREMVGRAQLWFITRTGSNENMLLTTQDLLGASEEVRLERDFYKSQEPDVRSTEERSGAALGTALGTALGHALRGNAVELAVSAGSNGHSGPTAVRALPASV